MNSRERFREIMRGEKADYVPYIEEPPRNEVLAAWRKQGLPACVDPIQRYLTDRYEVIEPNLSPLPSPRAWPACLADVREFRKYLDPADDARLPDEWEKTTQRLHSRDHLVFLRVHRGLFLSLGVDGWARFEEAIHFLGDEPVAATELMRLQGEFAASVADRVLRQVDVDAAIFSEPISDTHGPLVSPRMYDGLVLRSLDPVFEVLRRFGVETLIFMTYANSRLLLPRVMKRGFNCLWAYEVNPESMDYRSLRKEFGCDLRLIGGIDLDALREGRDAVRRELLEKIPQLLAEGRYIPVADGRIREDVPYANYVYFRDLLDELTGRSELRSGDSVQY